MGRNFRVGASGKRGEVTPGVARAQVYKYQDGQHKRFTQVVGSPRGWGVCVSAPSVPWSGAFGAVSLSLTRPGPSIFGGRMGQFFDQMLWVD